MADTSREDGDSPTGELPLDLLAIIGLTLLAVVVSLVPVVRESPLRIAVSLAFVLFAPGYAVVAVVFPARADASSGIDAIERIALSIAVSIPVVGGVGLALSLASVGFDLTATLPSITAVTLLATAIAIRRRRRLPPDERFRVPVRTWAASGRTAIASLGESPLSVVLGLSVILAVVGVAYAVAAPIQGETYTEFYLLTENETGERFAGGYPTDLDAGEPATVFVGIENHEQRDLTYTVVARLERIENGSSVPLERLDWFEVDLAANETWIDERTVQPTTAGEDLRVVYLLYRGSPEPDPSVQNAYRSVRFPVTVRN